MTGFLSERELAQLAPAELLPHQTPIPTQVVSSDEFAPDPQNEKQREVEARLLALADELGSRRGMDRRRRHGGILLRDERGVRLALCGDGRRVRDA